MTTSWKKKVRFCIYYMLYLIASIIVGLLLLEGIVRLFNLAPSPPAQYGAYVADPHLPFRPRPSIVSSGRSASGEFNFEYKFNSFGFRDVEHTLAKPEGTFRILGLGDSFTLGAGVKFEETYLRQLEKLLNERPGEHPPVEVVKAGVSNFFAETERLLFQHYGIGFKPDLVTVAFVPNDVIETSFGINAYRVTKLGYLRTAEADQLGDFGTWLYFHCHLLRNYLRKRIADKIQEERPYNWDEVYKENGFHEPDWLKLEAEYERMIALARKIDARIVFVHIPQSEPWDDTAAYPAQRLSKWCEEHDVPFVSTFPALREAAKREPVYWTRDGHCNRVGYRVIAETIFATLVEKNLVP